MHTTFLSALAIASFASYAAAIPFGDGSHGGDDTDAVAVCQTNLGAAFVCITDVSFTNCNGDRSVRQWVPAGSKCVRGSLLGSDRIVYGVATKTELLYFEAKPTKT